MISTMLATASTGAFGPGSADVRPYACAAARPSALPPVAGVQGTGLPFSGTRRRAAAFVGAGIPAALLPVQQLDPTPKHDGITNSGTTNDGTTPLGTHSPGRPKS